MKIQIAFLLLFVSVISANQFANIREAVRNNARLPAMHDPNWPKDCPVPDCEKAQRAVNYPAPFARQYYQCTFDGARWIPQIIPCPCDLIFSYKDQQCVYPWSVQLWCDYDAVAEILPVNCD